VLETLEAAGNPNALPVQLAYLASERVDFDEGELAAARRRALLVLAAGGDPHRELHADDPAVKELAADLDRPESRAAFAAALADLAAEAAGLPLVSAALDLLAHDEYDAWRWLACALLADELA